MHNTLLEYLRAARDDLLAQLSIVEKHIKDAERGSVISPQAQLSESSEADSEDSKRADDFIPRSELFALIEGILLERGSAAPATIQEELKKKHGLEYPGKYVRGVLSIEKRRGKLAKSAHGLYCLPEKASEDAAASSEA